uniref:Uncharacterized protein n=1 Tax=Equus asinus asinus TaxID=83772 RepID=A0A8C4N3Z9_EQUAS
MEPLRGWGPPPWSPAPKADALSLALYLLLLGSPRYTLATPQCKEEEYPVGAKCCPKCLPGRCHPMDSLWGAPGSQHCGQMLCPSLPGAPPFTVPPPWGV